MFSANSQSSKPCFCTASFGQTQFSTRFSNANFTSSYNKMPTSPASPAAAFGTVSSDDAALVIYQPNSLYGLYYHEDLHGPFANGRQANPFTPGLSPLSHVPKPTYVQEDPVSERFPATRAADDPLNWLTDELLGMRDLAAEAAQHRVPLRCQSMPR